MKALEGIKVLDLSRALAGPYCTMMLADMGAEVIKLEMPGTGDDSRSWGPPFVEGESAYFMSVNRNKKSITVNMKSELSKEIVTKLIKQSDVLVENFRPGAMDRLGFGNCTNTGACEVECPKEIKLTYIASLNREFHAAKII